MRQMVLTFSIILPTYKEKKLERLIESLIKQKIPKDFRLKKIIVIGIGLDKELKKTRKVYLIKEKFRKGKAHSISQALKHTNSDIIILQSADTLPAKNMVKNILLPFLDSKTGMVTGRPIPLDDPKTFIGFLNHLVWKLHHFVSLEKPKATEINAFRNVVKKIPKILATDEVYIESQISKKGFRIVYSPKAIVYNRGAKTIKDFIKHRRRIFIGHLHLKNKYRYSVSTINIIKVIKSLYRYIKEDKPSYKEQFWLFFAIFIEACARFLASLDYFVFKKIPYKWEIIKTAKMNLD
jgi:cellulose synthase/poly-beta-1,6-N-acetylglucosamine synthase-like glycosyltransferase